MTSWIKGEDGGKEDGEGCCLVLDECHRAKTKNSQSRKVITGLLEGFPALRVIYSSATAASEPTHLGLMDRLGLWGTGAPFRDASEFEEALKKG